MRRPNEWTEIEETVMFVGICEDIEIIKNELSRNGAGYELADGAAIPNLGERKCEVTTVGR